jgi:hypothetical protein
VDLVASDVALVKWFEELTRGPCRKKKNESQKPDRGAVRGCEARMEQLLDKIFSTVANSEHDASKPVANE